LAGYEVNYIGGEFWFNLFEGYEQNATVEFFCTPATEDCTSCSGDTTTYNIGISLNVDDSLAVKKVKFYINREPAV